MIKEAIHSKIQEYQEKGLKLFTSSSFQTHSIVLLHVLSEIDPSIPVYFINTGYHFPETITYRDQIADLLKLKTTRLPIQEDKPKASLGAECDWGYCTTSVVAGG